jgi:HEAT repeat protein
MHFHRKFRVVMCRGISWAMLVSGSAATAVAQQAHDQYLSTGDNFYVGSWLPLETPAAIDASFNMLKDVFNTRRIYWRGMEDQLLKETVPRPETVVVQKYLDHVENLIDNRSINDYAIQAAHARGMEIWGQTALYGWGSAADDGVYGFPGSYEHPIRVNNPEWIPVDKYGVRKQGGPLEYAYPGARAAAIDWVEGQITQHGYDGVLFHTYPETFSTRYGDEFGFSDPIVAEFQNRYGVNIREEPFNKEDWYRLRGEYATYFLNELDAALAPEKGIGVAISPVATHQPQLWLSNPFFPTAGNIHLDWEQWAQNGDVDQYVVWGGTGAGPTAMNELIAGTQGTGVELSVMTSSPYAATWNPYKVQGHIMTESAGDEWQYLLGSDIPVQPKSSLTHADQYKRMRTLAQIIEGSTTATVAEVSPLLNDSNLLNRRMALRALGKIGGNTAISLIENALLDPDESVRNAAIYGLVDSNNSTSYAAIVNAIDQHPDFMLAEGAYLVLIQRPEWASQLISTIQSHPDTTVRSIAMRSLVYHGSQTTNAHAPILLAAAQDSEPFIRAFAIDTMAYTQNSPQVIQGLVNAMQGNDSIIAARAATALSYTLQRHDPAANARRTELIGLLGDAFMAHGDGTQRTDKDWAFRLIGNALIDLGATGESELREIMNQRADRRASELAWQSLHLNLRSHSATIVTEEQDAYAHFKRPRWDKIIAAADDLNLKTPGTSIHNQPAQTGLRWSVDGGLAADNTVQSQYSKGGNAIKAVRRQGDYHVLKLHGKTRDVEAAEITTVTAKADWMHQSSNDATTLAIGLGGLYGPSVYVDPGSEYRIWQSDGTVDGGEYLHTGTFAGTGGFETIEIVLTFDEANGTTLSGSYDVFLTRDSTSSLGALSRTQLADDIGIFDISERSLMSIVISNQTHGTGDVTTYWDNVSLTVDRVLPSVIGDADLDGDVDLSDLSALAAAYGTGGGAPWTKGNFDADMDVDLNDLSALAANYGYNSSSALTYADAYALAFGVEVPEPGCAAIVAVGMLAMRIRRTRNSTPFLG